MSGFARLRFDFVDGTGHVVPMVFERPGRIIEAHTVAEVRQALADAAAARAAGCYVAGFVSYEAAPAFDPALVTHPPSPVPLVWFGIFDAPAAINGNETGASPGLPPVIASRPGVTRAAYGEAIAAVRAAIGRGDCYQVNYTFPLHAKVDAGTLAARYAALCRTHRAPFAAHLNIGRWQILSLSPELFFRLDGNVVTTRPMKGTAARGRFAQEDEERAAALQASEKNRAENVMIVDLMRNDIGRIADVGSVRVPSIFDVEPYPSVFQLTSTVSGTVRDGAGIPDIFAALFPAGSITGAPKTSAMRLLASLETSPRGVYSGAIGMMTPDGSAVFNVAIRTAVVDVTSGQLMYGVGGGITWDSTASDEYAEALSKATFLDITPPFGLVETLRLEDGVFVRRHRHVARLARSARYFRFPCSMAGVERALDAHARSHPRGTHRVRLEMGPDGRLTVDSHPFAPEPPARSRVVALSDTPVSSTDVRLFHKTTLREVYDRARSAHPDTFDVLLCNERDELTEFTIGNLVLEVHGRRLTPPVESGLLAGVFREELLERGAIVEAVLPRAALRHATRTWLVNSVRGWVEVELRQPVAGP